MQAIDRRHDRLVALKLRRLVPDEAREQVLAEGRTLLELTPHTALPVVRDDFFLAISRLRPDAPGARRCR